MLEATPADQIIADIRGPLELNGSGSDLLVRRYQIYFVSPSSDFAASSSRTSLN